MKMVMLILRIIGIAVAVVFLGFFVIPMTHGIINPGNIAGTFLCLWLLCVLIPPVHGAIKEFCFKHLFTKIVFRVVNIGFIAFAVYGAIVTSAMVWATTGELEHSLGVSPVLSDKNGNLNIKIGFSEPRTNGERNAKIASIIEYGKSGQPPKPFMKPAKSASRKECMTVMINTLDEEVRSI